MRESAELRKAGLQYKGNLQLCDWNVRPAVGPVPQELYPESGAVGMQLASQKEAAGEQAHHAKGLESALRQLEERCADLKEASAGHEERAREAAAEAAKAARAGEQLMVRLAYTSTTSA